MQRNWTQRLAAWLKSRLDRNQPTTRRTSRRSHFNDNRRGVLIGRLEVLEPRQLLTNVISVDVQGGAVTLRDISGHRDSTGDAFDVSYTGTQVVLTGHNDTVFRVGGQDLATYTATVTSPISLNMALGSHGNTVTVTGDGTAALTSLNVRLGHRRGDNSLTLTKVIANSVSIDGGRGNDSVIIKQSTINNDLTANLGRQNSDLLNLDTTTVKGNVRDFTNELIVNHSTITGTLNDFQPGRDSSYTSTASTYTGAVTVRMGRDGVVNMNGSPDGPNHFVSSQTITGRRRHPTTLNKAANSVQNDVTPNLKNVNVNQLTPTFTAPTVKALAAATTTPKVTGTFDSVNSPTLTVNVNGKTYKLGTDAALTSPTAGNWSLDLAGAPLTAQTTTVTAKSYDNKGSSLAGTGTVTNEQSIITSYLTKNSLTATKTTSGLNYVTTTPGNGAIPTNGKTVTAKYTGYLMNSDGTQGTQFDSNTTTGISFVLGSGQVIKGWDEAFALLPVGTVAKLLIPSSLAYGTAGKGTTIPANSILIFDVTVVSAV